MNVVGSTAMCFMVSIGHLFLGADNANAEIQIESDAIFLARSFVGTCAQNAGRVDKVAAMARSFDFKELDGDMKLMLAPQDASADYSGWFVTEEDSPSYLLGVSHGKVKGKDYSICVMANPNVDIDDVLSEISALIKFGEQLDDSEEAGQRFRVWATGGVAERSFLSVVDSRKMGIVGGKIAISAPTEQAHEN